MLIAILMLYFNSDLTILSDEQLIASGVVSSQLDEAEQAEQIADLRAVPRSVHTFNILALQQMGQHTALFDEPTVHRRELEVVAVRLVSLRTKLAMVGLRAAAVGLRDQGPVRAAAHLVARRARRGPHADFDDPGRRAVEDGRLRHPAYLLPDLSAGGLRSGLFRLHFRRGIVALLAAGAVALLRKSATSTAVVVDGAAWYWHFMTVLWVYILCLLEFAP